MNETINDPVVHRILETWDERSRQEGRQEGIAQERAIAQAREEELLQQLRQAALTVTQGRFPSLATQVKKQLSKIKQATILQDLLVKVSLATSQEEAEQYLLNYQQPASKKKSA